MKERSSGRKVINDLFQDSSKVYVIHYSCESFYEGSTGASKRVTSIAVRNLKTGQSRSWSLHKSAELDGRVDAINENLDQYERSRLDGYFAFLEQHSACRFIHWNMRDEHFGFYALEHKYTVLGGRPYELQDDKKVDLARVLVSLYGKQYAPHGDSKGRKGRIMALAELNHVTDQDALSGQEEAEAFVAGDFLKMHRSTLRKLDMFANFFERPHKGDLATNASWTDRVGIHPVAVVEWIKAHPIYVKLFSLLVLPDWWAGYLGFSLVPEQNCLTH